MSETEPKGLSGPIFTPVESRFRKSLFDRPGAHYNIYEIKPEAGFELLNQFDPDEMNLVFFSTSGVGGSYVSIEEIERRLAGGARKETITVLLVQPRLVSMSYGNIVVEPEMIPRLKELREKTWAAAQKIGRDQ